MPSPGRATSSGRVVITHRRLPGRELSAARWPGQSQEGGSSPSGEDRVRRLIELTRPRDRSGGSFRKPHPQWAPNYADVRRPRSEVDAVPKSCVFDTPSHSSGLAGTTACAALPCRHGPAPLAGRARPPYPHLPLPALWPGGPDGRVTFVPVMGKAS
jgi:hypothetical protein